VTLLDGAQIVSSIVGASLAAMVAVAAIRRAVPAVPALGLLVVIGVQSLGDRVLPEWVIRDAWLIGFSAVLATYPDGRFVPPWTRWLLAAATTAAVADAATAGVLLNETSRLVLPLVVIVLLGCQVHRYRRRSTVEERARVRWPILLTGWAAVSLTALPFVTGEPVGVGTGWPAVAAVGLGLLIPVGLVIGLLRPQLADVDRLLHHSVEWLTVSATTVAAYLTVRLAATAIGLQGSAEAAAAAAAVVTALVARPGSAWLADRFVGATKPDPIRTLAALGERFEQSLDGHELAASVARTTAEALLLSDVEVSVSGDASKSVGRPARDSEVFEVIHQAERVGQIRAGPRAGEAVLTPQDRALLRLIAAHAGSAMHAVRVVADLRRARERLVVAREEERRRLRRDLHDELAPRLAGLALSGAAVRQFVSTDAARASELAGQLADDLRRASQQVREMAYDLRPPVLDDLGLTAAVLDRVARAFDSDGLNIVVDAPTDRLELPAAVELAALRIVQEAVANTRKHAAASECRVVLRPNGRELLVEIADDGRGFSATARKGVGLRSMAERAGELGGTCDIRSTSAGTSIIVRLPVTSVTQA
jgi:signal transduction histidine kinase